MVNSAIILDWLEQNERSKRWLARKAGVATTTLADILNGNAAPRVSTLAAISGVTGIPLPKLVLDAPKKATA